MTDSNYEQLLKNKHNLKLQHGTFSATFHDKDGTPFHAKYDDLLDIDGELYYIEHKSSPLNRITSINASFTKLFNQCQYRGLDIESLDYLNHSSLSSLLWRFGYRKNALNYAWNHSSTKHSIIAQTYGDNYLVVFEKHPPTVPYRGKTYPFQQYYRKRFGLRTMLLSEFLEKFKAVDNEN